MNLNFNDDTAAAYGIWLFLALVAMSTITYLVAAPVMDTLATTFDTAWQDEIGMSTAGRDAAGMLKFTFYSGIMIIVVIIGAVMVVNRSIRKTEL